METLTNKEPSSLYNEIFKKLTYIFSEPHLAEIGRLTDDIIKSTEQTKEIRKETIQYLLEEVGLRGKAEQIEKALLTFTDMKNKTTALTPENNTNTIIDLEDLSETGLTEITEQLGIRHTIWLMSNTPIIKGHNIEREKLQNLYTRYQRDMEAIHEIILKTKKGFTHRGGDKKQQHLQLRQEIMKSKALGAILTNMITTVKKVKEINRERRRNSAKRLLCLPKFGEKEQQPKLPEGMIPHQKDEQDFLETWMVVSRIAEMYELTPSATITLLLKHTLFSTVVKMPAQIKINGDIEETLLHIHESSHCGVFPSAEDWLKAHNKFKRKPGERLRNCYQRLHEITSRRFHKADIEDLSHLFVTNTWWKMKEQESIIAKETRSFMMRNLQKLNIEVNNTYNLCAAFAIAQYYENATNSWLTKPIHSQQEPTMLEEKEMKGTITRWCEETGPTRHHACRIIHNLLNNNHNPIIEKTKVKCTRLKDQHITTIDFIEQNHIFKFSDIHSCMTPANKLRDTINKTQWKTMKITNIEEREEIEETETEIVN